MFKICSGKQPFHVNLGHIHATDTSTRFGATTADRCLVLRGFDAAGHRIPTDLLQCYYI